MTWVIPTMAVMAFTVASTSHDPRGNPIITPNEMRAQATSIFFVASVLPGIVLGATSVAMLTDLIFKDDYSIRYSLLSWVE